jgi:tRNA1(Val) A37 N6-methylase TrmN6
MDDPLTCDALTARFRVYQRARGHRFSVDDRTTAYVAGKLAIAHSAGRVLDLGTGIGSVLLMVASLAERAELVGIEAQEVSFALLQKNVAHNGLEGRVTTIFGDLRERVRDLPAGTFDLVTGTPPYLPIGTATPSPDGQRAAARIELRGGIEDYLQAAAHAVSNDGHVVVCADGRTPERTLEAARRAGLGATEVLHVIAREGDKNPLFSVWTLRRTATSPLREVPFVQRDTNGERTPQSLEVLRFFGLGHEPKTTV